MSKLADAQAILTALITDIDAKSAAADAAVALNDFSQASTLLEEIKAHVEAKIAQATEMKAGSIKVKNPEKYHELLEAYKAVEKEAREKLDDLVNKYTAQVTIHTTTTKAAADVAATDVAASEVAASEVAASEVTASEVAASEVAASEVAASEVAATEVAASEVAATEVAASEVAATEVAASEVAATDVAATDVAATDVAATDAAKKPLKPTKVKDIDYSQVEKALEELAPFKVKPAIKFHIDALTKHAEVLKGKGFNTELEKALRQTLTLLSDPKSTLDAYTKAADALIGHPQPGLKKLGLVMMALGGAVAVALATLTGVGAVAVAAVSIAALTSGGLGLFAGQRTGLSKIAMDLGVAAVKAEKAPEPARPAV